MNCPYCGKEMTLGKIPSGHLDTPLLWFPKDAGRMRIRFNWSVKQAAEHGALVLCWPHFNGRRYEGYTAPAYVCRDCKKGVFEFDFPEAFMEG